jgi:mRNA interferase RelE/StbE
MRPVGTRPARKAVRSLRVAEPVWEIRYKRSVAAELRRLDASLRRRIRAAIEERLAEDPRRGKRLRGLSERETGRPLLSLRVGDYRIIYVFSADELWVLVVRVGPRGGVYRER